MKLITLTILFMLIAGNVMAMEDCSKIKNGDAGGNQWNIGSDRGIARQSCRIANALELIAEKMK